MTESQTYTIKLEHFEGPFDLLLFFIERDELDVYDIPIAKMTNDFLSYIKEMESLNIELAAEFILVAASLMRIKAKLLLPRKPLNEEGDEIDPRQELVNRLLEYKRYKEIISELRDMEDEHALRHSRGNAVNELQQIANQALVDIELESLTIFNLMKAFKRVLDKQNQSKVVVHKIVQYNYTIFEQQEFIFNIIINREKTDFFELFDKLENRIHAITTFLALLELANMQKIGVIQGEGINNFWVIKGADFSTDEEE